MMKYEVVYCPRCGSTSIESEEEAMEKVWMFHRHYCQDCGCSFKVLRVSRINPNLAEEWWELLDWSQMRISFQKLPRSLKRKILEKGHWSRGKGKYADEK